MYCHTYRHRVRYRECDPMGVVYHTHYLDYFEAARTEALRAMGLAYKTLETQDVIMPVIDLAVKYKQPARYDDLLEITACFDETPLVRVRLDYEVRRADDPTLLVAGHTTLCFFDRVRNRPIAAPAPVRTLFERTLNGQKMRDF